MTILPTNWISCCLYGILLFALSVSTYNLDTEFPIIFKGSRGDDYFGFSVGLLQNINGYAALITAPRANSSEVRGLHQPGVLYNCNISFSGDTLPCQEVVVDRKGNQKKLSLNDQGRLFYQDKQDDIWLGVSLDVQRSEDSNVVLCDHLWKDQYKNGTYAVNGVCYVINKDLNVTHVAKQVPFVDKGYSVTSGQFFSGNVIYSAVGAPRDANHYGKVFIFMPVDDSSRKLVANETKEGGQFGEYFGASVSGIDLNGDGLTDLLVGAPFYSEKTGGDEGKVYVYISNGKELQIFAELLGQKKTDARFGTCIGDTGDLNQDGFNDVAIGAPYEDERGAVYIYHGTAEGLNKKYAQRISAEDVRTSQRISGFGISISRGLDTDDNSYLDLLIGSYSSSAAVLLRTRPVIQTASDLLFDPHDINRSITECIVEGERLTCFNLTYCLRYTGKHVPSSLVFKTKLKMDSKYTSARWGFLFFNGERQTSVTRNMKVNAGTNSTCLQETAYIDGNIVKDEVTTVQFFLSYDLDFDFMHAGWNKSFCKNCPVINPSSSTNISKSLKTVILRPGRELLLDVAVLIASLIFVGLMSLLFIGLFGWITPMPPGLTKWIIFVIAAAYASLFVIIGLMKVMLYIQDAEKWIIYLNIATAISVWLTILFKKKTREAGKRRIFLTVVIGILSLLGAVAPLMKRNIQHAEVWGILLSVVIVTSIFLTIFFLRVKCSKCIKELVQIIRYTPNSEEAEPSASECETESLKRLQKAEMEMT